ncbi:LodA/GoxA family CTQ-dependent oxidase [Dyella tabacisoli]|uniref:Catalase n=1 Tax=Dyella tabacisoli TaxID=2282381 RepID=A0A369ULS2_9GAMM|nr:LodA/GoxA family CTQ-dependent oxidase [Dyella tabacisoli]RDD81481.1 catalase [Dyella tabacisoli]
MSHKHDAKTTDIPCSCDTDAGSIECLQHMFVDMVQRGRIDKGQCPAKRPVFLRLHGVAHGRFEIAPGLSPDWRVGIFSQQVTYPVWARFSSDISDGRPDLNTTVGLGIKLFDVPGQKLLPPGSTSPTADFILQNHDVFFVDDARAMCVFTKASLTSEEEYLKWRKENPKGAAILDAMEKKVPTVLGENLWSVIPFRFGPEKYCKYKLEPIAPIPTGPNPDYNDPNYLGVDLQQRLQRGEARFRFMVQPYIDEQKTPLNKATDQWDEKVSVPQHVATLTLPQQDIAARGQSAYGEALSFNPWRTLAEHEPVGTIADARKVIYQASAELRRNVNGQPDGEPHLPRPPAPWPPARDTTIVRAAIHPGIGIARVGNSPEGFYVGPEVIQPEPLSAADMRDSTGALKRQAALFRLYGYNAAGEVVAELTGNNAKITWQVHLANRKAQWYQFDAALDIPQAYELSLPLRNAHIKGAARTNLAIDPGPRHIEGSDISGPAYRFDSGMFQGTKVGLGELRTDASGRLLVLGGHGISASPEGKPIYDPDDPDTFNNADGWYDDTSDGPVNAAVSIAGREIPVDAAWVVVAPPNYAPDIIGWRTLYDLLYDAYVECGWIAFPEQVSFVRDVLPALQRLSNLQWVNKGFAALFGHGGQFDFDDPQLLTKLSHRPAAGHPDIYGELRRVIFNAFRPVNNPVAEPRTWPWLYGDAFGSFEDDDPENYLPLSPVRASLLQRWVEGNFDNDWHPDYQPPHDLSQVELADRPAMLDQAALHFCLADAFHPGCELTWPMRHSSMYRAPFRIRERPAEQPVPEYGRKLTQQIALRPGGPLYAQGAGDLSRWMALPWQGDTAFCRSGYDVEYDPYLPSFWPARVPNQVLTEEDYAIVINPDLAREQRLAAFHRRANWLRELSGLPPAQMMHMVEHFGAMGIVAAKKGVDDDPDFPPVIFVESVPGIPTRTAALAAGLDKASARTREDRLRLAGWENEEQLEAFRRLVLRKRKHED